MSYVARIGHDRPVAIVGAGSMGAAFALVFARSGRRARVYDSDASALTRAAAEVVDRLRRLAAHGVSTEPIDMVQARISFHRDQAEALRDASLVQECGPETLDVKRAIFVGLDRDAPADAVLASSSSALAPSQYASGLHSADRILGGHPGNPPYLLPIIELIPSPTTSAITLDAARAQYSAAGLRPVVVRTEIEGFIFNRLQGAVLREAYCLVRDGVASVEDVDEVMRSGLGPRWSFMGPFETVDLNTRGGIEAHAARMGPAYERMGAERGQHDPWTQELVANVVRQRRAILDLEDWEARVQWRDEQLMRLRLQRPPDPRDTPRPPSQP